MLCFLVTLYPCEYHSLTYSHVQTSLGVRLEEMQRRLDEREAQHSEAMKSLAVGQEMQSNRLKELRCLCVCVSVSVSVSVSVFASVFVYVCTRKRK